jgi:spore maturation protein CgeB
MKTWLISFTVEFLVIANSNKDFVPLFVNFITANSKKKTIVLRRFNILKKIRTSESGELTQK